MNDLEAIHFVLTIQEARLGRPLTDLEITLASEVYRMGLGRGRSEPWLQIAAETAPLPRRSS